MFPTLKSEFRKLLTIRSTYLISAFLFALVGFVSLFVFGYKQVGSKPSSPSFMLELFSGLMNTVVIFIAIVTILLIVHEYRYNTINYTFTYARSRLRVLGSKVFVSLMYATCMTVLLLALSYTAARIGIAIKGDTLTPQSLPADLWWQLFTYAWGYTLIGVILAVILRSITGAIVTFFATPIVEELLSLLLKGNAKYLPFKSLDAIPPTIGPTQGLTHMAALGVASLYILTLGIVTVWLFTHRDAG